MFDSKEPLDDRGYKQIGTNTNTRLQAYYRFVVLFFNCMLTFGSYFCFDIPSVLQQQFQGNLTCVNSTVGNETECVDGLGMTPQEYNLLYAIYAWTNAVVVIMAGFLIDKLGNRFGVFLFSFLCVLGSSIFALGSHFKGTPYLLPLMLTGRLLFGSGNGSLTIVQNRITAFWFRGKELALAFGLTLSFSRLGSVLNFFLTQRFESQYGIQWTLWGGTLLCVLGFLSAVMVSVLDKMGMKQLGLDGAIQEESRKVRVQDVRLLSLRYWLLVFTIMFFYNGIFPFIADASKFIQDKYEGYTQKQASYIAGAVYDSSLVLSAAVGILIDYVGLRGVFAALCAVCTLPVFGLLAFTFVPPLVSTIWLGITYSFAAFGSLGYTIMGKTADLTVVQKTIIDTLHKEGKPQTFIAKEAGCSQSAVSKHVNRKWSGRKMCGRKRCTTNRENRSLMRIVKQNPFKNLSELHKEWTEAGVKASRATTHRRVKEFGYSCRIPLVKPLLNHRQRQRRLTWAKEKKNWTVAQWSKVLFSDESKFCISFGNQGPRVWRKGGEAHSPSCLKSSVKFPQSVMIWGAMSSAGVGPLCFLKTKVTALVYQEILEHFMLPSADQLFEDADFIFQQDLALPTLPKAPK
ncbi:hypothetical protein QTP86_016792, partial [Hemibagrus guttatus]